jgi:CarboxypepD_reg-like domain
MVNRKIITIVTTAVFISCSFAQIASEENLIIKGTVVDAETNTPLAYANVGIMDQPFGTLTDTTGHFSFSMDRKSNISDSLQISIVGYYSLRVAVKEVIDNPDKTIRLTREYGLLTEVKINGSTHRSAPEIIGRQKVSKLVQVSMHNRKSTDETIGSEIGMLYKPKRKGAWLKDFNFYISANNFDQIRVRLNIYDLENAIPHELINTQQIITVIDSFQTGWITIDLEKYGMKMDHEFVVAIQWVGSIMKKKENPITIMPVAATPFAKNCYVRVASQDKWKRMGINLSSYVRVVY